MNTYNKILVAFLFLWSYVAFGQTVTSRAIENFDISQYKSLMDQSNIVVSRLELGTRIVFNTNENKLGIMELISNNGDGFELRVSMMVTLTYPHVLTTIDTRVLKFRRILSVGENANPIYIWVEDSKDLDLVYPNANPKDDFTISIEDPLSVTGPFTLIPANNAEYYLVPSESYTSLDGVYKSPYHGVEKKYFISSIGNEYTGLYQEKGLNIQKLQYISGNKNADQFDYYSFYNKDQRVVQKKDIKVYNSGTLLIINNEPFVLDRTTRGYSLEFIREITNYCIDHASIWENESFVFYIGQQYLGEKISPFIAENKSTFETYIGLILETPYLGRQINKLRWVQIPRFNDLNISAAIAHGINDFFWINDNLIFFQGPFFTRKEISRGRGQNNLNGWVDLHTHPMNHLAFGGQLIFGKPDENLSTQTNCSPYHSPGGLISSEMKPKVIDLLNKDHTHAGFEGYPNFPFWPVPSSVTHQQMHLQSIEDAYRGGLRVMVSLASHNTLLGILLDGGYQESDKNVIKKQLEWMTDFVKDSDFMEIARTPIDLMRINRANKLAIILGVETEDFGDLLRRYNYSSDPRLEQYVREEIRSLYQDYGVRYIFPIHLTNSLFGGSALYDDAFFLANKYYTGQHHYIEKDARVQYKLNGHILDDELKKGLKWRGLSELLDDIPFYYDLNTLSGDKNAFGLFPLGRIAIDEMMKLGMIIDIDHMSQKAVEDVLQIAELNDYPLVSGHNGLGSGILSSENTRTIDQYRRINELGGIIGLGHGDHAENFVKQYQTIKSQIKGIQIAMGSDANGLYKLPTVSNYARIPDYLQNVSNYGSRTFSYNIDGVAHYGLFTDYIRSWQYISDDPTTNYIERPMSNNDICNFKSMAESFIRMWMKCEEKSDGEIKFLENNTYTLPYYLVHIVNSTYGGFGDGRFEATADVRISTNRRSIISKIVAKSSNYTEVFEQEIYRVPEGKVITSINSPTTHRWLNYISSRTGRINNKTYGLVNHINLDVWEAERRFIEILDVHYNPINITIQKDN